MILKFVEILLCRRCITLNIGKHNFQVYFQHEIVNSEGDGFALAIIIKGEEQHLGARLIEDSVIVDYCSTCHSSQRA
jgi:hypothetical protein